MRRGSTKEIRRISESLPFPICIFQTVRMCECRKRLTKTFLSKIFGGIRLLTMEDGVDGVGV